MQNLICAMAETNEVKYQELKGIRVVWEFKDFFKLSLETGQCISHRFCLSKENWEIRLYPKGYSADQFVSLYVENMTNKMSAFATLASISMKVAESNVIEYGYKNSINGTDGLWQFPEFFDRSKLLEILELSSSDQIVKVVCSFCYLETPLKETVACQTESTSDCKFLVPNQFCYLETPNKEAAACQTENTVDSVKIFNEDIENLYNRGELCDVKIKVGSKVFPAHRAILAARSPLFSSMFKYEMIEKIDGVIDISDCDPDSFEDFLKFLYTGKIENTKTNNFNLCMLAGKHRMYDLKKNSSVRLSKDLQMESICDVLELAAVHEETELLETATNFLIKNAQYVFATDMWHKFVVEKPSLAGDILMKMAKKTQQNEEK